MRNSKQSTVSILGLVLLGRAMEQSAIADFKYGQLRFPPRQKPLYSAASDSSINVQYHPCSDCLNCVTGDHRNFHHG
ncbi:MAG TPA: hypothetical protein VIM41_09840 [Gammaproteobacteria bacterium]